MVRSPEARRPVTNVAAVEDELAAGLAIVSWTLRKINLHFVTETPSHNREFLGLLGLGHRGGSRGAMVEGSWVCCYVKSRRGAGCARFPFSLDGHPHSIDKKGGWAASIVPESSLGCGY